MNGDSKPALRLLLYMPHAHWRVPYAYQIRHTFALPPFSTVIGLLCNVLGIRNLNMDGAPCQCEACNSLPAPESEKVENTGPEPADDINALIYHELRHNLELAIVGTFETKTREYTWFRNLSAKSHYERFGSYTSRIKDFTAEHPGGQQPVRLDILNNVYLAIYIAHRGDCTCFLNLIKYTFENDGNMSGISEDQLKEWEKECECQKCFCEKILPKSNEGASHSRSQKSMSRTLFDYMREESSSQTAPPHSNILLSQLQQQRRLYPLHLGRAEDWVVIEEVEIVDLKSGIRVSGEGNFFTWIPESDNIKGNAGLTYRVPAFYYLNNGLRIFSFVDAYLNDGKISSSEWVEYVDLDPGSWIEKHLGTFKTLVNSGTRIFPVFLAKTYEP